MLPDVDPEQWHPAVEGVLIGHGLDVELVGGGVVTEPAPTAALDADGDGGEGGLEALEGAEVLVDLVEEGALGGAVVLGRTEVLPKDGVVDVSAAVELFFFFAATRKACLVGVPVMSLSTRMYMHRL